MITIDGHSFIDLSFLSFLQVLADVFGAPVFTAETSNAAAMGAALRAEHGFTCRR